MENIKMTTVELKSIKANQTVDARGTACPGPLLAAKKAIGDIESGEILEVLSSDEGTKHDIPKWCQKMEHEFLGIIEEDSFSRLFLKKA
jgi:tRNA 2-thiouridine synthesizing protein A